MNTADLLGSRGLLNSGMAAIADAVNTWARSKDAERREKRRQDLMLREEERQNKLDQAQESNRRLQILLQHGIDINDPNYLDQVKALKAAELAKKNEEQGMEMEDKKRRRLAELFHLGTQGADLYQDSMTTPSVDELVKGANLIPKFTPDARPEARINRKGLEIFNKNSDIANQKRALEAERLEAYIERMKTANGGNKAIKLADGSVVMVDRDGNKIADIGDPKEQKQIDVLGEYHKIRRGYGQVTPEDEQIIKDLEKLGEKLTPAQKEVLNWLKSQSQVEPEKTEENGSGWIAPTAITAGGAAGTAGLLYKLGALNKTAQAAANPTSGVLLKIAQKVTPSSGILAKLAPVAKGLGVAGTLVGTYPFAKDIVQGSAPEKVGGALGVGGTLLGGGAAIAAPSALTIAAPILPVVGGALLKHNVESDLQDRPSDAVDQIHAYATGAQTVWPNTATQVMGALFGPEGSILDREYTQRIVDQRIDQIVGSVNSLLPPAKDKIEEKQRNSILRKLKIVAADRDPTALQQYLATLLQQK